MLLLWKVGRVSFGMDSRLNIDIDSLNNMFTGRGRVNVNDRLPDGHAPVEQRLDRPITI